jgi:hypothetical protein
MIEGFLEAIVIFLTDLAAQSISAAWAARRGRDCPSTDVETASNSDKAEVD